MKKSLYRSLSSKLNITSWVNPNSTTNNSALAYQYLGQTLNSKVYSAAIQTPLQKANSLSSSTGNNVYFKREDLQPVFSFKIRGAYNKIASLEDEVLRKGVVCCSAGNHAQGVAYSAKLLNIKAVIVMPLGTPKIKVNAVRRFGGSNVEVVLHGQNYDEASAEAKRIQNEQDLSMIHPFDDVEVIAGQGTIGVEILKQTDNDPDIIFVCCGGGGMLAGIAAAVKALKPRIKIIGVEADDAAGMTASLAANEVVTLPTVGIFADGAAVKTIGSNTWNLSREFVDEMITVSTDELCAAIKHGFNDTRCIMEPAGALGIAGMVKYSQQHELKGKNLIAILSGANMDFDRLRFVSERADSSEIILSVTLPETPGSFLQMYKRIYPPRNVTGFAYRCNGTDKADVLLSFQAAPGSDIDEDKDEVKKLFEDSGHDVIDLQDNEMAKAHARYLSGGRLKNVDLNDDCFEKLYRFEFPEAAGALSRFLHLLYEHNPGWSISLFHYRNHGHDFGRVLAGFRVPHGEMDKFDEFLKNVGYICYDESTNSVYEQFLR